MRAKKKTGSEEATGKLLMVPGFKGHGHTHQRLTDETGRRDRQAQDRPLVRGVLSCQSRRIAPGDPALA